MVLAYIIVLLPWAVRNYRAMGEFTFLSSSSGYNLWAMTRFDAGALWRWDNTAIAPWKKPGMMVEFDAIRGDNYYSSSKGDALFKAKFWGNFKKEPLQYVLNNTHKTVAMWSAPPGSSVAFPGASIGQKALLYFLQIVLLALAFIGFWTSRASATGMLVAMLMLYFLAVFTFAAPPADRLLLLPEVFMLVLSAVGICTVWRKYLGNILSAGRHPLLPGLN